MTRIVEEETTPLCLVMSGTLFSVPGLFDSEDQLLVFVEDEETGIFSLSNKDPIPDSVQQEFEPGLGVITLD